MIVRRKGEGTLRYEIYLDSLFLLNFIMNLYLLLLVNRSYNRAATRRRILIGALADSAGCCAVFLLPLGFPAVKVVMTMLVNGGALYLVFRPYCAGAFFRLAEKMVCYGVFLGGGFFLFQNHLPTRGGGLFFLLGAGGILWLFLLWREKREAGKNKDVCAVALFDGKGGCVSVPAVIDSGNCLREPISGEPVSVLDREIFESLFGEDTPACFRAIPYRSVGRAHGIMRGYRVDRMRIVKDGVQRERRDIYIGVSTEPVSSEGSYRMLLHPAHMREPEKKKRRKENDLKSDDAGRAERKNTV